MTAERYLRVVRDYVLARVRHDAGGCRQKNLQIVEGGWRLAGTISKATGAERKVHQLVRADTSPDREAMVAMTIAKAKRLIDEQGDRLFPDG